MKYKDYKPSWVLSSGEKNSYRFCSKWGNQTFFAEPSEALYVYIKERLDLTDEDFMLPINLGDSPIPTSLPCSIVDSAVRELEKIVGKVNVFKDAETRISCAYGKSCYDGLRLRSGIVEHVPDLVVSPSSEAHLVAVFDYCYKMGINIYPSGGRTNIARATECFKGGVMLDLKRNYNKILSFNEIDQTVTVMAGITGVALEEILNNAPDYFEKVANKYTCGQFPGSFEFSTVGGWVMSRAYGANFSRYGDISDILVSAKFITAKGIIDTADCNRQIPLPSVDELFIGSSGSYGLLLSATLKMRRHYPDAKRLYSYLFKDFDSAVRCAKELLQSENGLPSALRICDSDDTEIIMRANTVVDKGIIAPFVRRFNGATQRCLLIGSVEGNVGYCRMVKRNISRTAARYGGVSSTSYLSKKREKTMFTDTYTRDLLLDYNVVIDDVCCETSWSKLMDNYLAMKNLVENRKHTFCMVHITKATAQGCILIGELVGKFDDSAAYATFKLTLIKELSEATNSICFSHSLSTNSAHDVLTKAHSGLLQSIKKYLDPKNLLNASK